MKGLYNKYRITKANGEPIDEEASFFILRIDKDAAALKAAIYYAKKIQNQKLLEDLRGLQSEKEVE